MQQKYFETKHKIPIYLRDTAPINFDISLLITKINKIDKKYFKEIKKFVFVKQERLGRKKIMNKAGSLFVSNEIYDIDRCHRRILCEVAKNYFKQNEQEISSELKEEFFQKKVNFYYDIVPSTSRIPLCDFLYEERTGDFDRITKKIEYRDFCKAAEKQFLTKNGVYSVEDYFSDCFIGFYTRKVTKIRKQHNKVYKIMKK